MQSVSTTPDLPAWRVWLLATRPATLTAAVAPVLVGSAAADAVVPLRELPFVAALGAALLLQVGANFANDLADFERGTDRADRLGPPRVTQSGLVRPATMRWATAAVLAAAALIGVYLITVAGWPILVLGAAAIVAAIAYTGGPWPFGYHGLGDLFVFVFFGLAAVAGSYFVQTEKLTDTAFAAAIPVGMTVTAILVVNNLRDLQGDRRSGKRTLAVVLGAPATRVQYLLLIGLPYILVTAFAAADLLPWWSLLVWVSAPLAAYLGRRIASGVEGRALNPLLKQSGQLHLLFGLLLAASFLF